MKTISKRTENNPRPNLVGSPKIDCQSSENKVFNLSRIKFKLQILTVIVRVQYHLQHWKSAAGEIKQNISNTPPNSAFSSVVHHSLRYVFDKCNREFNVATGVEEVKPVPNASYGHDECYNNHSKKDANDATRDVWDSLFTALRFF